MGTAIISNVAISNPVPGRPIFKIIKSVMDSDDFGTTSGNILGRETNTFAGGIPAQWEQMISGGGSTSPWHLDNGVLCMDESNANTAGVGVNLGSKKFRVDFTVRIGATSGSTLYIDFARNKDNYNGMRLSFESSGKAYFEYRKSGQDNTLIDDSHFQNLSGDVECSVYFDGVSEYSVTVGENSASGTLTSDDLNNLDLDQYFGQSSLGDVMANSGITQFIAYAV